MNQVQRSSRIRVILDANVLISHLIGQGNVDSTINRVIRLSLGDRFEIILPETLLVELRNAPLKPQLAGLLSSALVEDLINATLNVVGTSVPTGQPLDQPIARDPGDNYLIETALFNEVDIIISGDKDLLVLRDLLERPRILSPADFLAEFGSE